MIHKAHHLLSFFPRRLRPEIKELYLSSIILNFGLALIFIFEPIYLFNLGYSLQQIMLFWVIIYFLYVLVLPLGGKISEKFGYEHTIFLGTAFWILLYLSMYLIEQHPIFFFITPLIYVLQKFTYWPAYHANFAKYSNDAERGREVGGLTILTSLTYVIGPAIGGLILQQWGFHILFIVVAAVLLLSNIPMLLTKEVFRSDPVSYSYAFKRLFKPENRRKFLAFLGFGEEILVVVVWPIFISLFIKDYLSIGGLVAVATLVTAIITLIAGRLSDRTDKRKILRLGTGFYFISWLMRLALHSPVGIFLTDTLSRLSKNVVGVPLTALLYEDAKNHTAINTVLVFEMSLAIGKFLTCLLIFLLLFIFGQGLAPFYVAFAAAGLITWLYVLL